MFSQRFIAWQGGMRCSRGNSPHSVDKSVLQNQGKAIPPQLSAAGPQSTKKPGGKPCCPSFSYDLPAYQGMLCISGLRTLGKKLPCETRYLSFPHLKTRSQLALCVMRSPWRALCSRMMRHFESETCTYKRLPTTIRH